jgi:hypothetical protein
VPRGLEICQDCARFVRRTSHGPVRSCLVSRAFTLPNTSSELAIIAGTQTFIVNKTFSGTLTALGTVTVSAAAATIGTAATTATYDMGMPITSVGTVSTPTLAATNLASSMRRWRLTSAAVVDSAAEQRSAGWACWRGNVTGLGGRAFVTRISRTTLQATGLGFFGLDGSTAALATTLTQAAAINCIGIGFQRGTHTRWQLVADDGTGAPTLTDMGVSFAIATGGVLTLFIAAPPNGSSVRARVVDEVSGAVFEQEIAADLPANTQFLSPQLFINDGATAATVAYDCSGGDLEADY